MGAIWLKSEETLDSAFTVFTILSNREMTHQKDLLLKAKSLNNLGYLYTYHYYDFKEAYRSLQDAEDLCNQNGFYSLVPLVELNLANLIYNCNLLYYTIEIDESLEIYKKALAHAISADEKKLTTMIFANIIDIAFTHDCPEQISDLITEYRNIDIPKDVPLKSFVDGYIEGVLAYWSRDYDKAIKIARHLRTLLNNNESRNRHIINCYILESRAYAHKGDIKSAVNACDEAITLAKNTGDKDATMAMHQEFEEIYLMTGDEEKARQHHFDYLLQKDSILNDFQLSKVHKMDFRHTLGKINETVKNLELKNMARRKTILWMAIAIILLLFLISILIYFQRIMHQKNRHLYQSYQEILKKELPGTTHKDRNNILPDETIVEFESEIKHSDKASNKYKDSMLDEDMKQHLWTKILNVLETSPEIYSQGFSASTLASLAGGMDLAHLSQVIGEMSGTNFYNLLCKYRIMEACRLMNSEHTSSWTVEGISMQTGFKSRSNFSTNFKKIVGMSPAQYMKEARRNTCGHK